MLIPQGHLHPLHRGVYAVGHRNVTTEGRFLAAVKACGPEAVLSHFAAACLHCLLRYDGRPIDVTAPTKRKRPTIRTHRSDTIECVIVKQIPVTPKLRTVIDLARVADDEAMLTRALRAAKFTAAELAQLPTGGRIGKILDLSAAPTASHSEDFVLNLVLKAGLAHPEVNQPQRVSGAAHHPGPGAGPEQQLIVEVQPQRHSIRRPARRRPTVRLWWKPRAGQVLKGDDRAGQAAPAGAHGREGARAAVGARSRLRLVAGGLCRGVPRRGRARAPRTRRSRSRPLGGQRQQRRARHSRDRVGLEDRQVVAVLRSIACEPRAASVLQVASASSCACSVSPGGRSAGHTKRVRPNLGAPRSRRVLGPRIAGPRQRLGPSAESAPRRQVADRDVTSSRTFVS